MFRGYTGTVFYIIREQGLVFWYILGFEQANIKCRRAAQT